ncbi:hypothetical protein SCLCIDRAFT_251409 [Scleroderma citrinum Foug A]|uniref:Uncharacterized protein n=1 Tax=Scleroderma citrinum Foug A TaxID=1036808 RepID=A0A0C3AP57_9AGAM|nr:hypothetical protein SCLCIDRAFT_251409 [Scleroderma citrinum Foug A]
MHSPVDHSPHTAVVFLPEKFIWLWRLCKGALGCPRWFRRMACRCMKNIAPCTYIHGAFL